MSRTVKLLGSAVIVVLVAVGGLAWWLGYFSDAPEEATVAAAAEAAQEAAEATTTTEVESEDPAVDTTASDSTTTSEAATVAADGIDGTWTVVPNETATFVGYRINEVLSTIGEFEVVGRTPDVTGTLTAQGSTIQSVDVTADMTTLSTDNSGRDGQMRRQALETSDFPSATFVLTEPIELGEIPAEGLPISTTAIGELTVHGVTQSVEFPLDAQLQSGSIVVAGQLEILLADYEISQPSAPVVASVEDHAILELSLIFSR